MTKRPRVRCIFCRGDQLTREHIIPDWIREIIPKKPYHGHAFALNASLTSRATRGRALRHKSVRRHQGHPISRKVRVVCRRCNIGWLSDLEDELKPQIKALVLGETVALTPWDQRRLATWAAKTSMTAEFIHPETAAVTFDEREYLRLHREPPRAFNVWAGHYEGSRYTTDLHHHSVRMSVRTPTPPETLVPRNTQTTIIGLGKLFLQISSSSLAGLEFNLQDERSSNLRRIWPPVAADLPWPPATSLSDEDINIIHMGLHAAFAETA